MSRADPIIVRAPHARELDAYGRRIAAIEAAVDYPLGTDRFHIDHGADYFAFFRRLGRLRYVIAERTGQLLAMLAATERRLADGPAWYLGDLKLAPAGQGLALTRRLLAVARDGGGPARAYGISMNPGDGTPNRVVRLLAKLAPEMRVAATLNFYSVDGAQMRELADLVATHRGPLGYLSLAGIKDIVLHSTGRPMRLVHVQHGPCAEAAAEDPIDGGSHMFCTPEGDALDRSVRERGCRPMASATVIQAGMGDTDWSFVLSSDI
jgi:hypothetical protein